MVAQLVNKEADLCGASLTVTADRGQAVDFSLGLAEDVASLAVPSSHNAGEDVNFTVYLSVFNGSVWIATLLVVTISTACYVLSQSALARKCPTKHFSNPLTFAFYEFFLSLIQRSEQNDGVDGLCNKVWFSSVSLFSFFLFALYTGDLTASMTAAKVDVPLRTYSDVLNRGYTVCTSQGTASHDLFKRAPEGTMLKTIYQTSFATMSEKDFFTKLPPRHAFFINEISMFFHEDFVFLEDFEGAISTQLAFAFQKNSELKPIFDYHILKLKQSGVMAALESHWHSSRKPEDMSKRIFQEDPIILGYNNLFFPMFVMSIGIVLGIILVCLEMQFDFGKASRRRLKNEKAKNSRW